MVAGPRHRAGNAGVSLETIRRNLEHANAQTVLRCTDQRDAHHRRGDPHLAAPKDHRDPNS
jgi:hypothetical protein